MNEHLYKNEPEREFPTEDRWSGIDPESHERTPRQSSPLGIVLAWTTIILLVALIIALPAILHDEEAEADDRVAMVITELTAKYFVGAGELLGDQQRAAMKREVDQHLGRGTISQRQRVVILFAELGDAGDAAERLAELNQLIEQEKRGDDPLELTEDQQRVQQLLNALYPDTSAEEPNLAALSSDERAFLRSELGWFGDLALTPRELSPDAERDAVIRPAKRIIILAFSAMAGLGLLGLVGLAGLILLLVFSLQGRLTSGLARPGVAPHGIYAETFAVWLGLFMVLQIPAGLIGQRMPEHYLFIMFVAFMGSLIAVAWPMLRGVPWHIARADIGLTLGRRPALEPLIGLAGYPMAVPMITIGVVLMFILMMVQSLFQGIGGDPLAPDAGPAHPIIVEVAHGGVWQAVQLLLVAAVAAPIVEEIVFRGAFYRHLRDATRGTGMAVSILLSTIVNTFIFAIIHPQGWVAAPALMSLAVVFTILREWRGTVIPAIVTHAVWNGIVMSMLLFALRS